jgi:2-dehydropantoate 2-reductase
VTLRIGLVGAGAIGGFLTAHLTRAGALVHVLARGGTLAAWRDRGLTLTDDAGAFTVRPAQVAGAAGEIGPVDLILFTVKGQDSVIAAESMVPMVGPDTCILSFQNGLAGVEHLAARFGAARVLAGVTYVPASVPEPGQVRHTGLVRRFVFGPLAGPVPGAARRLADLGQAAGLEMTLRDDPMPEIWAKFVMLAPFHLVSALTRLPLGGWIGVPETRAVYAAGMEEVAAIARASGVVLPDGIVQRNLDFSVTTADPRTRASMLDDLDRGRPLELEATVGWLVARAAALGVPVPVLGMGRALVLPHAGGQVA